MTGVHFCRFLRCGLTEPEDLVIKIHLIKPFLLNSKVILGTAADIMGPLIQGNLICFSWIVCIKNEIPF